jgi:anti-sigma regulatory factor (Ser/Thr protein kinase)
MPRFLSDVVEKVSQSLAASGPVAFQVICEEAHLPNQQALAIGIIANELVTNALKYAFPAQRSGQIQIELKVKEGIELVIRDNGSGVIGQQQPKGLGSRIVGLLTQQLEGTLSYERVNPGVEVVLRAPLRVRLDGSRRSTFRLSPSRCGVRPVRGAGASDRGCVEAAPGSACKWYEVFRQFRERSRGCGRGRYRWSCASLMSGCRTRLAASTWQRAECCAVHMHRRYPHRGNAATPGERFAVPAGEIRNFWNRLLRSTFEHFLEQKSAPHVTAGRKQRTERG